MPNKPFFISAEQIRPLAPGHGAAIVTDQIMVDGKRVGYMYRTEPLHSVDSGWAFLSGEETDVYLADTENSGIYDVNTVANYDPEIIPLLDAPIGSAFVRSADGLQVDPRGAPES